MLVTTGEGGIGEVEAFADDGALAARPATYATASLSAITRATGGIVQSDLIYDTVQGRWQATGQIVGQVLTSGG
ncbi:hypothetical protein [Amycolatopsis sp. PS_44_ISF1]|uniref:hypothetical protein n=1 Tax=Amycolatopsis sp. PS_44_ISF1 TaxID=2974917 RepID=UPI0028E03483|nr:hypothetical protein [Amycolatopsis sp. PS_44_ISF1]MDT8912264.1 hypothetical protein [Amycolatopsis sp. PS_44_ISF1]